MTNPRSRDVIFRTFKEKTVTISPPSKTATNPTVEAVQDLLNMMEVFGMGGKSQPLFGDDVTPILARRFMIENYLFSEPDAKLREYSEDCRVATAIWYLMYNQIVRTPESYDAALPLVPPSPQDAQIAAQILKMVGTFTHTAVATSTAPLYMDALIALKSAEELAEFLRNGPNYDSESLDKVMKIVHECEAMITEAAYPPVITLARSTFDYVKKLTSARYLLPDFVQTYTSVTNQQPFEPMAMPSALKPAPEFQGYIPDAQRLVAFGGLDIPQISEELKRFVYNIQAGLMQLAQIRTTLQSGLITQHGSVITHLDSLGSIDPDPAIGGEELHYPTPLSVYLTPSYIPKYKLSANGIPQWVFEASKLMFTPFFATPFQIKQLQDNITVQAFSWDTEVNLPPSPATGAEFGCLMIPYPYVSDCSAQSISNDIASVDQFLSSSPYRPMKNMTNYFTPLFRAMSTGLNTPTVIANAVASMFTIYRKKAKAKAGARFDDPGSWEIVKPQIPFIYGHPVSNIIEANAPWSTEFPCSITHTITSYDGMYMAVLHRALPKPSTLSYIPFTMEGGIKVSLPVARKAYSKAISEIPSGSFADPEKFYADVYARLSASSLANNLIEVKAWAPSLATFPHIFLTNRHIPSAAGEILASINQLSQKLVLTADDGAPFGGVLSYFNSPLIALDQKDKDEAITTSDTIFDIGMTIASKSDKAVVKADKTELPKTHHSDEKPINHVNETPLAPAEQTKPNGKIEEGEATSPGSYDPEIKDDSVETNPES